jgi:hypothetical protein
MVTVAGHPAQAHAREGLRHGDRPTEGFGADGIPAPLWEGSMLQPGLTQPHCRIPPSRTARCRLAAGLLAAGLTAVASPALAMGYPEAIQRIGKVTAADEIVRFHNIYGFQQDHLLKSNQSELAHPEGTFLYKYGAWKGVEGAHRLWVGYFGTYTGYVDWPIHGAFIDHKMAQPVITVSDDLEHVRAYIRTSSDRFFSHRPPNNFNSLSKAGADHSVWYKTEYRRDGGQWKMSFFQVCIVAEGVLATGMANLPKAGVLGAPAELPADWWKQHERLSEDAAVQTTTLYPENWRGPDYTVPVEEFGCYFAKNQVMARSVSLPFNFPNPVTGRDVAWQNH